MALPARAQNAQADSDAIEPYRVIGNIYYVGTASISSFLIRTTDGLVLIDTGYERMVPGIRASIEKLGFRIQDVKIMLSSHSHIDHVQGHAAMQKLTGAQIMALGEDAAAIKSAVGDLETASHAMSEALYKAAGETAGAAGDGAQAAAGGSKDDDAIDAEFEVKS